MSSSGRIVRTGLSGLAGTLVDVVLMIGLVELGGVPVGIAAFLGAAAGAGLVFLLSKFWAFRDPARIDPRQVGAFAFVAVGTALFVAFSVHVLASLIGVQYLVAKAIASTLVFLFWSYPLQSRLVFPTA